jgi:hypothetical protein
VNGVEELRREIERLRAFVEIRVRTQEDMARAMLAQSTARAAEALEARIQLAAREAMAYAEQGLQQHEAALRALGRRVAELAREEPATAEPPALATGEFVIGRDEAEGRRLAVREQSEADFLFDLANLAILPGGAARLVAAHVVEFAPQAALAGTILPHWRSRLARGGELILATLDGPAWGEALAREAGDFARLRARLGAEEGARPPRSLFDEASLRALLAGAGFTTVERIEAAPLELRVSARAGP